MRTLRLLSCSAIAVCALAGNAVAQTTARFDVAVQTSVLRLDTNGTTNAGIGGRFSFELTRRISLDAEATFFPSDDFEALVVAATTPGEEGLVFHRRRVDVFGGVKAAVLRGPRIAVFGKVRPGLTRLSHRGVECIGDVCARILIALPEYRNEFALDAGGIVEIYPTGRTILRVDIGDTMIRHRSAAPPCNNCTTHNFSTRFGVGFRF
jgi:hypothetical protein